MDLNREPSVIADSAAEEVRTLIHATLPGKDAFKQPADVYSVTECLSVLVERLPQALQQLATAVQQFEEQQAIRMDDGSDPSVRASEVLRALLDAQRGLLVVQDGMRRAKGPLAGMGGHWTPDDEDEDGERG